MNEEEFEDLLVVFFIAGILTVLISTCLLVTESEIAALVGRLI